MKAEGMIKIRMAADVGMAAREAGTERIVEVTVQAVEAAERKIGRPPLNLALVLDRSGSMGGEKLSYVKQAVLHVLDLLDERDQAALVVYDNQVDLLSASRQVNPANRESLKRLVHPLKSGNTTNLAGGWLAGCEQAAQAAQENSINRTLLLTDGLANVGITDSEMLAQHALELSQRGVTTSTFGVGLDYNHHLLEAMANQGGGSYYFIETPSDIPGIFSREFQELASVTAQDVEIVIELLCETPAQVLGDWRVKSDGNQAHIKLGNLFGGRQEQIYLKMQVPAAGDQAEMSIKAAVQGKTESGEIMKAEARLTFRCGSQQEVETAPRDPDVMKRYAMVEVAQKSKEALKMERDGEREEAYQLMQQALQVSDAYLEPKQAKEYQRMSERMRTGMEESDRKQVHYRSYLASRHREE
jgi:Ca-activated chloride channel family protein